jgi:hypothetical protein
VDYTAVPIKLIEIEPGKRGITLCDSWGEFEPTNGKNLRKKEDGAGLIPLA